MRETLLFSVLIIILVGVAICTDAGVDSLKIYGPGVALGIATGLSIWACAEEG